MASSLVSEGLTLATSQLQALYTSLPPSLQAYIDLASQTIHRNLPHQLQKYSRAPPEQTSSILANLDPTTIATAWILPLIALIFFMTRNYWHGVRSGEYSPATQYGGAPRRVTEGDYEYLDEDDYNPQNRYRNERSDSYNFPRTRQAEPVLDPDILIMKHKGTTYPLHFPAYDIAEGRLSVGDLRKVAAEATGTRDPRCIKLLYKGKSLRDDHRACKEENLKQNSEILCVISSEPYRGGDDGNDSSSSASSEMIANGIDDMGRGARIDVDGTIINDREPKKRRNHRGGRQKKRRDPSPSRASPPSSSTSTFLQPPSATSTNGSSHSHTTSRQPSPHRPTQPPPEQQQKKPSTPSEALDQISTNFHQTFKPQCERFISHPPSDPKTRDFEYKKLSEGILAQVILKLDGVVTEGDEGVRARRKELVRETQAWLGRLDERGRR